MRSICLTLIGLGLAASAYLLYRHFALGNLSAQSGTDFCSAVFGMGCDEALQSPLAVQFGLPLAGWGLVYYGTLASLLLLGWTIGETFRFEATTAALLIALAAALGSIALSVAMLTGLSPFCPLCAVVHTINLLLLFPLKRLTARPIGQLMTAIVAAARYVFGGKTADPVAARWKLVGFLTAGLVGAVIYQWVLVEVALHARPTESPFDPEQAIARFESGLKQEIPITEADPRLGPTDAPVRMVVFSDFQCPGCTAFSQTMAGLARGFDGKLQIVFKHYPLGTDCNGLLKADLHPRACEAALAAEAARHQGKFWAFHDALFAADLSTREAVLEVIAGQTGLDLQRFEVDRRQETVAAKVKADVELGILLGVDGTPSVFLNGRRVYDLRPQLLKFLIAHQLPRTKE